MILNYNVSGENRKRLVQLISESCGCQAKYLGAPTFSYQVDYFTIDRNGCVSFDDRADSKEIENLIERLEKEGFSAAPNSTATDFKIEIPLDKVDIDNLSKLIKSKAELIKKALGIYSLPLDVRENSVAFPWFTNINPDDAAAYSQFIAALCEMSKNLKRVTATEKDVDNEKYAFRCFLLRLGFIGSEYKTTRKILLRNLSGSSAFKNAVPKEACK